MFVVAGFGYALMSFIVLSSKDRLVVNSTEIPDVTSAPNPVKYHEPLFSTTLTGCE